MKYIYILFIVMLFLAGCDIRENIIEPGNSFTQIIDHSDFSGGIEPLSIVETPDSGYLVLAAKNNWEVYLMKTDLNGQLLWEMTLPEPYVNPLQNILQIDEAYYISCMDATSLGTYLLKVDLNGAQPQQAASFSALSYPLSISHTGTALLIQGYDRTDKSTTLNVVNLSFDLINSFKYPILEDKEEELIKHITRIGKRFPFFCGQYQSSASMFYFNGFSNYALSLTFVNPQTGEISGSINGFRNEEYTSGLHQLPSGSFVMAGLKHQDTYLLPNITLNSNTTSYLGDLIENRFPEIATDARVAIREYHATALPLTIYATASKNNRLLVYAYDQEQGLLKATAHIGQSNPYELGDFQFTSDGGMILLAKTYVANRFPRLALFKLSKTEWQEMLTK